MNVFTVRGLRAAFGETTILENIGFDIAQGTVTAVVGPNGAGKTTLIRLLSRTLRPTSGRILYKEKNLFGLPTREVAKTLAVLPQVRHAPDGLTVEALAGYGRFPHGAGRFSLSGEDNAVIEWALRKTHITRLRTRPLSKLSGGEQQRAWIAMALAQKPEVLILDEPTTFLDIAYQLEILEMLRALNRKSGLTIIMVLHDLNHALRYADIVMIINNKQLRAIGAGKDVLTPEILNSEFRIDGDLHRDHRNGRPFIVAHKRVHHKDAL